MRMSCAPGLRTEPLKKNHHMCFICLQEAEANAAAAVPPKLVEVRHSEQEVEVREYLVNWKGYSHLHTRSSPKYINEINWQKGRSG